MVKPLIENLNKNGHGSLFWIKYLLEKNQPRGGEAMSWIQLNPFFDFCRVKVVEQSFDKENNIVTILVQRESI